MSSIDRFIEYVTESYSNQTGRPISEVRSDFAAHGIDDAIRRYRSPFISHNQKWRFDVIERQLANSVD
jgi:hypothetical protein